MHLSADIKVLLLKMLEIDLFFFKCELQTQEYLDTLKSYYVQKTLHMTKYKTII